MAPPGIIGRSKGLYPQRPRWQGGLWNGMFPGMGGSAAAKPRDQQLYGDAANMPLVRNLLGYPGRSPSVRPVGMGFQAGYIAPVDSNEFSAGSFYRRPEGTQGIFSDEDQGIGRVGTSGYRGFSPLSPAAKASQGMQSRIAGIEGLIGQISEGRQNLQDAYSRQQELRQGQFNSNWQQYAQQAPLMNGAQSPQFGQTAQGLGPGGVPQVTPQEQAMFGYRNRFSTQPGTANQYDRFGMGSPLDGSLNAAMLALQGAGRGVVMQPGGYGSPLEFVPQRQSQMDTLQQAEMQQRAGLLNSEGMLNRTYEGPYTRRDRGGDIAYTSREQALRDAGQDTTADQVAAARQAKFDAFRERRKALGLRTRDDIAGRRADRDAERSETMQNRQAQMLSRRGISPLSPEGQSLAPDLYTSIQNRRRGGTGGAAGGSGSPLTTPDGTPVTPVAKGAPQNPTTREQARTASHAMLTQRPVFRSIGLDAGAGPDEMPSPSEVVQGLNSAVLQSGAGLTDDDLKDLHEYAVQVAAAASPNEKPFSAGGLWSPPDAPEDQWNELATLPSNDAKGRRDWWDRYKAKHLSTRPKPPGGDVGNSSWSSPLQGQIF